MTQSVYKACKLFSWFVFIIMLKVSKSQGNCSYSSWRVRKHLTYHKTVLVNQVNQLPVMLMHKKRPSVTECYRKLFA